MIEKIKKIKQPIYEKMRVIFSLFSVLSMGNQYYFNKIYGISQLNLRYLVTDEKEENSIMDKCYKFYNSFINSITEESAIFQYLLLIDGGSGFYKKENFDLKNLNMIKSHLRQIFPKIILLCYIENGEVALTESNLGGIVINEFYITKNKNIDYNSSTLTEVTENEKNDIDMNLFLDLFHEAPGHKKFALSEEGYISPKKIFNKNKKFITLRHKNDYVPNDEDNEYILTSEYDENKGDSGHFLELCYGKYKNELIIDILRKMENKGKLINYPKLFTDDGKKLNEYVSLRKQIEENKITFNFYSELSIDDDIFQMKKELEKIDSNKKSENIEDKTDKNNYLNRGKRQRDKDNIEDDNDDKSNNKKKKGEPNYLKSTNTEIQREEKKKDENEDEDETQEKDIILDHKAILENARKQIGKRYKLVKGPGIKLQLLKLRRELDVNDPIKPYVLTLLAHYYIKF